MLTPACHLILPHVTIKRQGLRMTSAKKNHQEGDHGQTALLSHEK